VIYGLPDNDLDGILLFLAATLNPTRGTWENSMREKRHDKNILVTGPPRIGKSTLIERLVSGIQRPVTGFFTREIRDGGKRVGFSIVTLEGKVGVLAHQDIRGRFRVGKYGVNMEDIDRIAVPSMIPAGSDVMIVIDEIGKMECFSTRFRESLIGALDSENPVLGSIALKGSAFIEKVKRRKDISLIEVTEKNRDELVQILRF
jgi:nucleoside-triphosphatase THEP1